MPLREDTGGAEGSSGFVGGGTKILPSGEMMAKEHFRRRKDDKDI